MPRRIFRLYLSFRYRGITIKMTIEKNVTENTACLKLSGWLDTQSTPILADELSALEPAITGLVLDLSQLEYISSAGMRQIVAAYKKMGGALTLRNVSDEIMGVIKMTGLDKRLRFE